MGASERRSEIVRLLCRRRFETVDNLAFEFGVSERTIRRDIEVLSLTVPLYTQSGRYGGGVYIEENYKMDRMYMTVPETQLLKKILNNQYVSSKLLNKRELALLLSIIANYEVPKTKKQKGRNNDV